MIAYVSGAVAASPVGRSYVKFRDGPFRRLAALRFFDWVIPSTLVTLIILSFAWVLFAPK